MRLFLLLWLLTAPAFAYYPYDMWQASRAAANGDWTRAEQFYARALQEKPTSAEPHYNLGLCYYRQGKFDKAEASFKKCLELNPEPKLRGQASYNLGNVHFRKKEQNLEEALKAYKAALRWIENDEDTRYNIQVVLDMMKKNQDKNKDQKDKKDKNKDKNKDKDKDKNNQGKDKDKKKDEDKKKPKDPGQPKKDDKPKQDQQKNPGPGGQKQPSQSDPNQMDKNDAERILNYFQNREKKNMSDRQKKGRMLAPPGVEDW